MMDARLIVEEFFDLSEVPFSDLFETGGCVWGSLARRDDYILDKMRSDVGRAAPDGVMIEGDVHIGEGTVVEPGAYIKGPTIIGKGCQIRHGAYIRGNVITGNHCVIGHTTEVIRSILLNHVRADHFAYVGDSILGNNCHLGAGVILANVKMRKNLSTVRIRVNGDTYDTGMRKLGAIMGDNAEIGCNSTLNPGTVIEKGGTVYPGITVWGYCRSGIPVRVSPQRGEFLPQTLLGGGGERSEEKILCPRCGDQITSVSRVKDIIDYCQEFRGQCGCGQRYSFKPSFLDGVTLSFPDRQVEIVCQRDPHPRRRH